MHMTNGSDWMYDDENVEKFDNAVFFVQQWF